MTIPSQQCFLGLLLTKQCPFLSMMYNSVSRRVQKLWGLPLDNILCHSPSSFSWWFSRNFPTKFSMDLLSPSSEPHVQLIEISFTAVRSYMVLKWSLYGDFSAPRSVVPMDIEASILLTHQLLVLFHKELMSCCWIWPFMSLFNQKLQHSVHFLGQ